MATLQRTTSLGLTPPVATKQARLPALDAARFIASLAVIWIHVAMSPATSATTSLARFAVPFFSAAAAFFMLNKPLNARESFADFLATKLKRLYLPFLVWSMAYVALKLVKRILLPGSDCDLPGWEMFLVGGAYHLWFVPFLILACCGLFFIAKVADRFPKSLAAMASLSTVTGALVAFAMTRIEMPDTAWAYMLQATPGLLWGAALALTMRLEPHQNQPKMELALVSGLLFILVQTILLRETARSEVLENFAGVSLLILVMYMPQPRIPTWISRLGQVAFGIYLSHLLFVKVLEPILGKLSIERSLGTDLLLLLTTAIGASFLSLVLARSPRSRWLVS